MTGILADAVQRLNLRPGQTHREIVNGYTAELRIVDNDQPSAELAEQVMLNVPSFDGRTGGVIVRGKPGPAPLPDPPVIPSDEDFE